MRTTTAVTRSAARRLILPVTASRVTGRTARAALEVMVPGWVERIRAGRTWVRSTRPGPFGVDRIRPNS